MGLNGPVAVKRDHDFRLYARLGGSVTHCLQVRAQHRNKSTESPEKALLHLVGHLFVIHVELRLQCSRKSNRSRQTASQRMPKQMKSFPQRRRHWELKLCQLGKNLGAIVSVVNESTLRVSLLRFGNQPAGIHYLCPNIGNQPEQDNDSLVCLISSPCVGFTFCYRDCRCSCSVGRTSKPQGHETQEHSRQYSNRRHDYCPSVPPHHAICNAWLHARADSAPQLLQTTHSLIPLWTRRHSGMTGSPEVCRA